MNTTVTDNPDEQRFEIHVGGDLAGYSTYRPAGQNVIIDHTEIDERFEGQGLGGALISAALDQLRERGLGVIPLCPFAAAYIGRHPEYVDVVAPQWRSKFT